MDEEITITCHHDMSVIEDKYELDPPTDMERQKRRKVASNVTKASSKNVYWTLDMDDCLCNLLIDQIHRGGRIDGKFTTNAWREVVKNFNGSHMTTLIREHFKSHMRTWRKTYSALTEISSKSGFIWNPIEQCFAGEASAIDAFYEKHDHLMPYKNKKFPLYEKFLIIFGKDVATESGAVAGDNICDPTGSPIAYTPGSTGRRTTAVSDGEDMLDLHPFDLDEDEGLENIEDRVFMPQPISTRHKQSRVRPSSEVTKPRQRNKMMKQGTLERIAHSLDRMTNVIEKLGSHIEILAKYKTNDKGKTDEERVDKVCKYVSEIPDILPGLIYPTVKYIMANDKRASMFLGLHAPLRPYWLQDNLSEIVANSKSTLSFTISPSGSTTLLMLQPSGTAPSFVAPSTSSALPSSTPSSGFNPTLTELVP